MQGGKVGLSIYAKIQKARKNYRLLSGLRKQLSEHDGVLLLHDTNFSRVVPKNPGFLIYDCVDLPLMHQRTSKVRRGKHKYLRTLIDCNAKQVVCKSDLILLTSPHYRDFLFHWINKDANLILLRNFIPGAVETLAPNIEMKKILQLEPKVSHWIVIHNRIGEFLDIDGVLKAVNNLQQHWGVCFLGVFDGKYSKSVIEKRTRKYCPDHTVLCQDALYGDDKLSALKCFDLGLVPLIAESQNLKRCIPNRTLEFLGVGLPQIVYRTKALKKLSTEFPDSIFVPKKVGYENFEVLLKSACEKLEQTKVSLTHKLTPDWSDDFGGFFNVLDTEVANRDLAKDVVIVSENNPHKNNRLANIQNGLKGQGYSCTVLEVDTQKHEVIRHI